MGPGAGAPVVPPMPPPPAAIAAQGLLREREDAWSLYAVGTAVDDQVNREMEGEKEGELEGEPAGGVKRTALPEKPKLITEEYFVMARSLESGLWEWVPTSRKKAFPIPDVWARSFVPGRSFILDRDSIRSTLYSGRANLKREPTFQVSFSAKDAKEVYTQRDVRMTKLLSSTGCVPTIFEIFEMEGKVFSLKEAPGSETLDKMIRESVPGEGRPRVRLEQGLPIMIDLLRAITYMEERGIIHGDLVESKVYLLGPDSRAVVRDFSTSRISGDGSVQDPCAFTISTDRGAAYRLAPEMKFTTASSLSNNVWQLGLVFSRMVFGKRSVPSQEMAKAMKWLSPGTNLDCLSFEGRRFIHDIIVEKYDLEEVEAFKRLTNPKYNGLKDILLGMLRKDYKKRLTASEALQAMEAYAKSAKVEVPEPRRPAELPEGWAEV